MLRMPDLEGPLAWQAVVTEFAPATASPLGLPWERHERCRAALEAGYLREFFMHGCALARKAAAAAPAGSDGGECQACLELLSAILAWDFRLGSCCVEFLILLRLDMHAHVSPLHD